MRQRPLCSPALVLLLLACVCPAVPGEITIRLVDSARNVPLEYWVREVRLPVGGKLYCRAPSTVYVDGKAIEYGGYLKSDGLAKPDAAGDAGDDAVDDVTGKSSARSEKDVRSDRSEEVLSGFKAEIRGDFHAGEHVIEPGGIRFTVDEFGEASSKDPALTRVDGETLRLRCVPVSLDFVCPGRADTTVQVSVSSGGKAVLANEVLKAPAHAVALRLYLPVSSQPYVVRSTLGQASFLVEASGLRVHGEPALREQVTLVLDEDSLGFISAAATPRGQARAGTAPTVIPAAGTTADPELYAFTDRNRAVFVEGEPIDISVRGFGLKTARATPRLDLGGETTSLIEFDLTAHPDGRSSAELRIDTRILRPGRYVFRVQAATAESNPVPLQIVSAVPPTHLRLFGWYKWGSDSYRPEDLDAAVRSGLNLVAQGAGHGQGGSAIGPDSSPLEDWYVGRSKDGFPQDDARSPELRAKPHFPVELAEGKLQNDAGAEFLLSHGIENLPNLSGAILYFNVGAYWQGHADDRYQAVQHLAQEWRRFPNFVGMVHCTGDGPTPATSGMVWAAAPANYDIIHGERLHKLREAFEHAVGKIKIDDKEAVAEFQRINQAMRGAIGFGVGMDAGLRIEGDDAARIEWSQWVNDLYPRCFRNEHQAMSALFPHPAILCGWTWGPGIGSGMFPETFYGPLSHPVSDDHGDYGIVPFAYLSGMDIKCAGLNKRPWVSLDLLPERPFANGLKLFLEAMSRNPAGIGVLNTRGEVAGGWSHRKQDADSMVVLAEIGRRFGDLLLSLERRDEVAVLLSFRQAATGGQDESFVWGAHFLATKAGYQANVISESEILKTPETLSKFRALFLVQMSRKLPEKLESAIRNFQQKGGIVIEDTQSNSGLPDVIKVDLSHVRGANEVNFQEIYERFEPLTKSFCERVRPRLRPLFEASVPHVHVVRSADQDIEYWTLIHDGLLSRGEFPNGHFAQFLYRGTMAEITTDAKGILYDALRRERVELLPGKPGTSWRADLRRTPGTFYLLAARPIAEIEVQASRAARPGSLFSIRASLIDDAGKPFAGKVPIEVVLTDPNGSTRAAVYRTTNQDVLLKVAGNDPAGAWRWRVTDQATALVAEGTFDVAGDPPKPRLDVVGPSVFDAPAIHAALKSRTFDIVLFPDQIALRETVDGLATRLTELGVRNRVRILLPSVSRPYRMNWNQWTIEDEDVHEGVLAGRWLGYRVKGKNQNHTEESGPDKAYYGQYVGSANWVYYHDVILVGRSDLPGNPLTDLVTFHTRMLPRNVSPNFPAQGGGLLAYAWAPFHYGHDAIVAWGTDDPGLRKATGALVELAKAQVSPSPDSRFAFGRHANESNQTYLSIGLAAEKEMASIRSPKRLPESLLPPVFDWAISDAATDGRTLFVSKSSSLQSHVAPFTTVDFASGTVRQYRPSNDRVLGSSLGVFQANFGRGRWTPGEYRSTPHGLLTCVDRGLALLGDTRQFTWFFEPVPARPNYEEARYPRRCHSFVTTADGKWVLATFYDLSVGGGYGPYVIIFNPGVTVLLDAETGKEVCRYTGYCARWMALAEDGTRAMVIDDIIPTPGVGGRSVWNPHDGPVLAAFDSRGNEVYHLKTSGVQRAIASRDARRAVLAYEDTRRYVSLIDVDRGTESRVSYAKTDCGTAIAPDGRFAVIAYTDGLIRCASFDGTILSEKRLPAPGLPVVRDDGTVVVAAADGRVHFPGSDTPSLPLTSDTTDDLPGDVVSLPPNLSPSVSPFWQNLPEKVKVAAESAAGLPRAAPEEFQGTTQLRIPLPKCESLDVLLLSFDYCPKDPNETVQVAFDLNGRSITQLYPGTALPRTATLAFRPRRTGETPLTLKANAGATIRNVELRRIQLSDYTNVAFIAPSDIGKSTMVPRVMVPQIHGIQGDPRVEQMDYGFPPKWGGRLPPDMEKVQLTEVKTCFDGDIYSATALYPSVCPAGHQPWYPAKSRSTLRSAEVIMEFDKPIAVEGIGIWEHPHDLPVRSFILEYCDDARVAADMTRRMSGNWKIALSPRDNQDYYHAHFFPKPIPARFWRYTILDTPALVQRVAEIELYVSAETMMDFEGDADGSAPGRGQPGSKDGL